ncbi:MAG: hypothetical protein RI957_634 [Verrucomicrobiota bacterium]|jgi:hypothetical protein
MNYKSCAMPAKKAIKRYTEEQKSEILAFIEKHNAEKGRGGQTVAIKKFGVTAATLAAWGKKSGKKAKKAGKAVKKTRNPSKLWDRLNTVKSEIAKAEKQLAKLNREAKELRKEIRAAID